MTLLQKCHKYILTFAPKTGGPHSKFLLQIKLLFGKAVPNLSTLVAKLAQVGCVSGNPMCACTVLVWVAGTHTLCSRKWSFACEQSSICSTLAWPCWSSTSHQLRVLEWRAFVLACKAPLAPAECSCVKFHLREWSFAHVQPPLTWVEVLVQAQIPSTQVPSCHASRASPVRLPITGMARFQTGDWGLLAWRINMQDYIWNCWLSCTERAFVKE